MEVVLSQLNSLLLEQPILNTVLLSKCTHTSFRFVGSVMFVKTTAMMAGKDWQHHAVSKAILSRLTATKRAKVRVLRTRHCKKGSQPR